MATVSKAFKVKSGLITPAVSATTEPLIIPHGTVAPTNPTNGSIWTTTAGIYVRINGSTVGPLGSGTGGGITVSDTPPVSPTAGNLWYESDTGNLYIYYDSFWVQVDGSNFTNPMTAVGDMIYGGTSGVGTRLGIGTAGQALVVNSGATAPTWNTLTLENLPGAFVKKSVKVATTGSNITLSGGAPSTLDGISLSVNDRILVKDQTAPAQNGIYIVQTLGTGANGTWVRSADADTIDEIASAIVAVDSGATYGGFTYDNDLKITDTLGTTNLTWNRVVDDGYSMNIGTTAVQIGRASGALTLAGITLSAPTFTGTITTSLTTAGYVTTTAGGVLGSVATIPNAGLTNSSITIGSTSISLGGTATTVAGLTLTSPVIDTIAASAAAATPVLWSTVTTGSIGIGQGLTTGALNIATVGTGATPISIGHTNATIGITGNTTITGTLTITGNLDTNLTTAGVVTTNASGVLSSSASLGVANGGTGLTATPTNGQLPIGNGSGYTLATITQGTGITVTNGAGTISVALTNSSVTIGSTSVSLGGTATTVAGLTLTTPTIDVINASSATATTPSLYANTTSGTINIGALVGSTAAVGTITIGGNAGIAGGTKTINIGTGATAGTTTITIGSATGSTTNILGTAQVGGNAILTAASTSSALTSFGTSPSLSGTPTAPTAAVDTNTTQIATTAYVVGQGYLKSATASSTYAPLASPALTGTPTAPTAAVDTNTTQVATTAYVIGQGYLKSATATSTYAPLASPALTGIPTAPTAAAGTNTTQIATTEFVTTATAGGGLNPFLLMGA